MRYSTHKRSAWQIVMVVLTVLLAVFTFNTASTTAQDGPLPPQNPWAVDRPDDTGGMIDLGWSDSATPDIAEYRVYRSNTPAGPYTYAGKRSTDRFINYLGFVDVDLHDGTTYYYVATCVDRQGRESAFSPEVSAVPVAQKAEAAVTVQKSMVLSLADQKLYCMENGRLVYVFLTSTGTSSDPTPTGNFRILYHDEVHPVPKYPGCVCYYWMGFYEDYAIHAWPTYNGVQGNYSYLGHPASHGCVRLDPTLAHIPFYWAPNGTPLSIIAGPYTPPPTPYMGGHVSMGSAAASDTWYFAEGYTGGGFNEYVLIYNPQDYGVHFEVDFMLPDGSMPTYDFTVGAKSRLTLNVDDFPGMDNTNVSVRLRTEQPVVAERSMYFDYNGKTGGHVASGITQPADTWYFAEGYTGGGFDEYILVQNPQDLDVIVNFDFMLPDGSVYTEAFPVYARSRATICVDAAPGMDNTNVSVRLRSDLPVVAERSMYFGYNEGINGGHAKPGVTELSSTWYFAEGYTGGGFDEYILLLNPHDMDSTFALDLILPDGNVYTYPFTADANSRVTVNIDAVPNMGDTNVSVRVRASIPLVAERSMYFGYQECPGGHVSPGCTDPGVQRFFAEGCTSSNFDTYVLIVNPGDEMVGCVITFCKPNGEEFQIGQQIQAHSRWTIKVNTMAEVSDSEFAIQVDSTGPLVVERSMYFNIPR
ncbi:MAG: L,D-transpeptidase family protein [Actinomycetota bacterium]|nr:L,D-transpeptidase family protein [Actinomycetota bacterium]